MLKHVLTGLIVAVAMAGGATAGPQWAIGEVPEPGTRYEVTGVTPGDRLNVRARPEVSAEVAGSLSPDANNIVITGQQHQTNGTVWWSVVCPDGVECATLSGRGTGCVNARVLSPQSNKEVETNFPLTCSGTEPFWSLQIKGDQARYSESSDASLDRAFKASPWVAARGLMTPFVVSLQEASEKGFAVVASADGLCSDGMSDTRYPFYGTLIRADGDVVGGCCWRSAR